MSVDTVAILGGTGPQGKGLGLRLARAGVPVVLGSRDAARAQETAASLAGAGLPAAISGAANADAAAAASVVVVGVPWEGHGATLATLAGALGGRLVVDMVVPLAFDERGPVGVVVPEGSAAEQAQALLPDSVVVSAFHHVAAKHLLDESHRLDTDVLVCGDDDAAKRTVRELAELIPGVRAVDAGPLRLSRFLEGMTPVLLSVNRRYRTSAGIRLSGVDPARERGS